MGKMLFCVVTDALFGITEITSLKTSFEGDPKGLPFTPIFRLIPSGLSPMKVEILQRMMSPRAMC